MRKPDTLSPFSDTLTRLLTDNAVNRHIPHSAHFSNTTPVLLNLQIYIIAKFNTYANLIIMQIRLDS